MLNKKLVKKMLKEKLSVLSERVETIKMIARNVPIILHTKINSFLAACYNKRQDYHVKKIIKYEIKSIKLTTELLILYNIKVDMLKRQEQW